MLRRGRVFGVQKVWREVNKNWPSANQIRPLRVPCHMNIQISKSTRMVSTG